MIYWTLVESVYGSEVWSISSDVTKTYLVYNMVWYNWKSVKWLLNRMKPCTSTSDVTGWVFYSWHSSQLCIRVYSSHFWSYFSVLVATGIHLKLSLPSHSLRHGPAGSKYIKRFAGASHCVHKATNVVSRNKSRGQHTLNLLKYASACTE